MIELIDLQTDRAVGMRIAGKIEREDIDLIYTEINDKLRRVDRISVYVEVDQFTGISLDALLEDLKEGLPKIGRLRRKAVVSNAKWLEAFTKIGDRFLLSIEARHFPPEEKEEAKAWVLG